MFSLEKTDEFDTWLKNLKNPIAKKAVIKRLARLEVGHFGDVKNIGDGIFELRIHVNVGIRIYCIQKGDTLIIVLNAGDKSTQQVDIAKAKELNKEWDLDNENNQIQPL
ncbi:type II toxin-antitoxin system RelE/ParE family toxin [Moraxella oblonga]|uniref:type II toxin-antitoxin system RelE/ParE family toxin n=1 Tax=Moraxella oblonga TaxID=200413 RepID=UPI0008304693|nr:type II toxin-antitoxin system RelE/ParE family toxin [Moraxella oblonga]